MSLTNFFTIAILFITDCASVCYNGGSCRPDGSCVCPKGYKGKQCQKGTEKSRDVKFIIIIPRETRSQTLLKRQSNCFWLIIQILYN